MPREHVLTKILRNTVDKPWNYHKLSMNDSFQLEWLKLFPDENWNFVEIAKNKNFRLEWLLECPDLNWDMKAINERILEKDFLIMPDTLIKLKNFTGRRFFNFHSNTIGLDFGILSSYSFDKENEIYQNQITKRNVMISHVLNKYFDKTFIKKFFKRYLV